MKRITAITIAFVMILASAFTTFAATTIEEASMRNVAQLNLAIMGMKRMENMGLDLHEDVVVLDDAATRGILCPICEAGDYIRQERVFFREDWPWGEHYVSFQIVTVCTRANHYTGTTSLKCCDDTNHSYR